MNKIIFSCIIPFFAWPLSLSAGEGDVYFCEMEQFVGVEWSPTGYESFSFEAEKFKFKTENGVVKFGDSGFFKSKKLLYEGRINEAIIATSMDSTSVLTFNGKKAKYTENGSSDVYVVVANCDKF